MNKHMRVHNNFISEDLILKRIILLIPVGMARRIEDHKTIGGASSPKPLHLHPSQVLPAAQVGGGKPTNIGTLERTPGAAWHRPPVSSGGRRVTTGATGGEDK